MEWKMYVDSDSISMSTKLVEHITTSTHPSIIDIDNIPYLIYPDTDNKLCHIQLEEVKREPNAYLDTHTKIVTSSNVILFDMLGKGFNYVYYSLIPKDISLEFMTRQQGYNVLYRICVESGMIVCNKLLLE
jgi:hypothetical protein